MAEQHERREDETQLVSRSFSLDKENLDWLERAAEKGGRKSVSNMLNFILTNLRTRKNIGMHYEG